MMATEATVRGPVDVSVNEPSLNQLAATESGFQNVDQSNITVNGVSDEVDIKHIADILDECVNSAEASVGGGSDTEALKTDPTKALDDTGHARSSSAVKKPTSFKSVSVNRTFLASKGTTSSTSRPESAAGSASTTPQPTVVPSASRLKLVAKSGSNLGGASKTLSANGKPPGAPDPNLVWNRNRAPTQPEAKKRSDEELKDAGIHLADRLGPEDLKGQSNWADIDDDDEWAPDTITWTDGTKITLPAAEEATASPPTQHAAYEKPRRDQIPALIPKSRSPAPISSATASPSVKHGVLASGKGLVLKGASEKPTLVAKPPAPPGPAKSPWAALPPVEKVPPATMDFPNQTAPVRYPLRDALIIKSDPLPPPTKEIPADDFSRSYQEGPTSRELFNSQSGRYEPVSGRRGSRHDANPRQPAVLQRQTHHEPQGPAEPSAAFQSMRSSMQEGPYNRRRGSSNVSGGSGLLAPRVGAKSQDLVPPPELGSNQGQVPPPHAGSVQDSAESPAVSQPTLSAHSQQDQRAHPLPTFHQSVSPHQAHAVPAQSTYIDGQAQKDFMKKKREEAVRRRVEEEAREEAAKQARIAAKLKALGPAPERKSAKKDSPSLIQRTEIPAALAVRAKGVTEAPKPDSVQSSAADSEAKVENPVAIDSVLKERIDSEMRAATGPIKSSMDIEQPRMPPTQTVAGAHGQPAAPWTESPQHPDRFQTWTGGHQGTARDVWGAPGNGRSLGNGTFNADIGPLPESHAPTGTNIMRRPPAPIGPPLRSAAQATHPDAQHVRLAPIGPPAPPPNGVQAWKTFDIKADDEQKRLERLRQNNSLGEKMTGPSFTDTWRPVALNGEGKRSSGGAYVATHRAPSSEMQAEKATPYPEHRRQATAPHSVAPPTGPASQARTGSRFFPASNDAQPHANSTQLSIREKSPTPPPPTADGHPVYDGDATKPHVALPPQKPRVRLPPSEQSAASEVTAPQMRQAPVSFAAAAASNAVPRAPDTTLSGRPVSRGRVYNGIPQKPHEIASQENWQSKINNLMGKKSTSPTKSMPIGSSILVPFESSRSHDSMDVPLLSPSGTASTEDSSFTSREMAEECFGEQEMGSLPAVRLPTEVPDAAWQAVQPNWFPVPNGLRIDPVASESFKFGFDYAQGKSVIRISTPGMSDAKIVIAPILNHRSGSNPRRAGPRTVGPRHAPRNGRRGGRDAIDHIGDHNTASSSSRTVSSRGPRNFRARGETWSRQGAAISATQS
ncbi:hypothetical protein F4808DRAFT_356092 [Astrocystis sublimbata]|nr:hypothetical protein F4808DRAFT_356092 [Astrocystis sublimbata]